MKIRFFALAIAILILFTGCQTAVSAADAAQIPAQTALSASVTAEQAQKIALEHAGFTADQVSRLRTEYEPGHGRAHYDVEFDADRWEYDYEIDAKTGEIISYQKDD